MNRATRKRLERSQRPLWTPKPKPALTTKAPRAKPDYQWNKFAQRFPAKPWFKVDPAKLKTHQMKRAARARERLAA